MLNLQRRSGETICIGDDITLTILDVQGMQVKMGIEAPEGVAVDRQEVRARKDAGIPPPSQRRFYAPEPAPAAPPPTQSAPVPSPSADFRHSTVFIDGAALATAERLHDELALKLGFPKDYGRNWDALLDCLSSIDDPQGCLCAHWRPRSGKHLALEIFGYAYDTTDATALNAFAQVIADANSRLREGDEPTRIWLELTADLKAASDRTLRLKRGARRR